MKRFKISIVTSILLALVASSPARASEPAKVEDTQSSQPADAGHKLPLTGALATDYCVNFGDKAAEAKMVRHKQELEEVRAALEARLAELKKETELLESWVNKREAIRANVGNSLVKMYAGIEPEAAADQMKILDISIAAEILRRLNPKRAGEIVSLMDAATSSRIVQVMAADSHSNSSKDNATP